MESIIFDQEDIKNYVLSGAPGTSLEFRSDDEVSSLEEMLRQEEEETKALKNQNKRKVKKLKQTLGFLKNLETMEAYYKSKTSKIISKSTMKFVKKQSSYIPASQENTFSRSMSIKEVEQKVEKLMKRPIKSQ